MEEKKEIILDKLTHTIGYFKGISNVLRSSGDVDPLALSGDFESLSKDMLLIKNTLIEIFYTEEETK